MSCQGWVLCSHWRCRHRTHYSQHVKIYDGSRAGNDCSRRLKFSASELFIFFNVAGYVSVVTVPRWSTCPPKLALAEFHFQLVVVELNSSFVVAGDGMVYLYIASFRNKYYICIACPKALLQSTLFIYGLIMVITIAFVWRHVSKPEACSKAHVILRSILKVQKPVHGIKSWDSFSLESWEHKCVFSRRLNMESVSQRAAT